MTMPSATAAVPPSSVAAASSRAASMPTRCTRAPSATKRRAVASPIPLSPPVISAILPSSLRDNRLDGVDPLELGDLGPAVLPVRRDAHVRAQLVGRLVDGEALGPRVGELEQRAAGRAA